MRTRTLVSLTALLWTLPYVLLLAAGGVWLWEQGWSLWWLLLAACSTLSAKLIYQSKLGRNKRGAAQASPVEVIGSPLWTPAGKKVWVEIEKLAARESARNLDLNDPAELWSLLQQILQLVAREFHPRTSKPELEITLPEVMLITELVARDLKDLLRQKVPGSHLMTLGDLRRLQEVSRYAPVASLLYRMVMFAVNPASGVIREIGSYAQGELFQQSTGDLQQWLTQSAIMKAGYYAIELYSGHLVLREMEPGTLSSQRTESDTLQGAENIAMARQEPLRILVLGQVKAGKSSLINAMFGELPVAAADSVPRTSALTPYFLRHDEELTAVVFDSAGYAEGVREAEVLREISEEASRADLLIWVCSAVSPAREPDRKLLDALRAELGKNPQQEMPPVLVVVTHIDLLRPVREWSPPYDLRDESNQKGRNIHEVIVDISKELEIPIERVIPVCLGAGEAYNVESGVLASLMSILPVARRLQCQRCLREHHDSDKWQRLWNQTCEAGRVLLNMIQREGSNSDR